MKVNRPLGILYRFYIVLREKFNPRPLVTEEEKHAVNIAKKLISNPESILYFAPVSQKRIIKNEAKRIYVLIEQRSITIINHVYSYNVYIETDNLYVSLIHHFDTTSEKKKIEIEKEIRNNVQHSLKLISDNLGD